jgi:hypothetical protein
VHFASVLQIHQSFVERDEAEEPELLATGHLHFDALIALAAPACAALDAAYFSQRKDHLQKTAPDFEKLYCFSFNVDETEHVGFALPSSTLNKFKSRSSQNTWQSTQKIMEEYASLSLHELVKQSLLIEAQLNKGRQKKAFHCPPDFETLWTVAQVLQTPV